MIGLDGTGAELIIVPAGGSLKPASQETVDRREHFLSLQGRKVFRFAVTKMAELVELIATRNGIAVDDIDLMVPHQANLRIIEAGAHRLGISMDRVFVNVDRFGNTSSASVPMALDEAARTKRLERGQLVCMMAFGGGLSWGATLMRW
ncbi:MAG: 3-oxoacyl-[acyl-carrier-protein] synthase III C-terminal domain-containing protein [Planctomycetota bacterium]